MDKFFSLIGKILVGIGLIGVLVGGGYYLGTHGAKSSQTSVSVVAKATSMPTKAEATNQAVSPTSSFVSPTQTATGRFVVNAGGVKPFSAYTLSGVTGWAQSKTGDASVNKVVLTKRAYSITILQGAFGGGGCTFPGDASQEMSVQLTSSTMISLLVGNPLRRGQAQSVNSNQVNFTVCQKTSDGHYGTFTDFGAINYVTPLNPDSTILAEMDAMVGSLQKQ